MKTARLPCGCRHELGDRERWVEMCSTHQAEWSDVHGRWTAERRARVITGTCTNGGERRERAALLSWLKATA